MAAAKSEHALWAGNPTVIICLLGFLDLFGVSMIMPLIQSHAKELGASPSVAGLIGSIYGFLQLFSSPIVGKWSDLVGHRIVLLICLMATGGGYVLLGLSSSLILLALSRIPSGLFKHTQTISKAYLAEVIPPEQRATVYGQFNAVSSVGFIIGPTVGGHLAESSSSGFVFVGLLAGLVFFTSAVIVRYCLSIPEKNTSPQRDPIAQQSSTVTDIFRNINVFKAFAQVNWAKVWDLFLVNFLLGFGAIMFRSNFTRMLIETFQTSPKINGYVISVGGILSTLFSFIVGRIAKYYDDDTKLFLHSSVLNVLGLIGLFFAPNVIWFVLLQSPSILASSVNRVIAVNLTVEKGGKSEVGGLMGLNQSLLAMSRTLAPLLAGVLMEFHSMGPVLGSCVVSSVAIGAMCMLPGWKSKPSTKKD